MLAIFYAKTLINSNRKCVTCKSDSESQASLSQFSLISLKKKEIAYKKENKVTALTNKIW